jgi:endoribonuclease Dicer
VTRFYFDDERKYSPADLVDLRSATAKNITYAAMAARHDFNPFLYFESDILEYSLDKFQLTQARYGHQIPNDVSCCIIFILKLNSVSLSLSLWQYVLVYPGTLVVGVDIAFDVEAPKAFADIFKSVAGAIFIDSDMSLEAVWKSYYPFLHQQMGKSARNWITFILIITVSIFPDKFRCNIPKCPIRLLHEKYPDSVFK